MNQFFSLSHLLLGIALCGASNAYALELPTEIAGRELVRGADVRVSLAKPKKGTVIVFLSAKCPCSASHEPVLKKLHSQFAQQGFEFVGIHSNGDEDSTLSGDHFKASALPFPVIQDDGQKLANAFGALKTPHVYVLRQDRKVVYEGGVDETHIAANAEKPYLKDALAALSAGREPAITQSRVLGCVIKRN